MKKKVLFVDDERQILQGIKRLLRPLRDQWDVDYEDNSRRALQRIEQESYDVVVSDMKMAEFNGVDVLKHAQQHCPHAVRIGLSGYADAELALEAAGVVHQFFAKPCELKELTAAIQRIEVVQQKLGNADLHRQMAAINELPSVPELYKRVMQEASSQNGTLEGVGNIIQGDLAMTAKILSIVNSPFFGLQVKSTSPQHAASLIGFDAVRAMVLTLGLFQGYEEAGDENFLRELMDHSVRVSGFCTRLAHEFGLEQRETDQCVLAGMLHDLGKLVIHCDVPHAAKTMKTMVATGLVSELQAERDLLGCTHMDIGAYILTLWGFTNTIVEAVAFHHEPSQAVQRDGVDALTVVHIASAFDHALHEGCAPETLVDQAYLARFGLEPPGEKWLMLVDSVRQPTAA